MIIDRRSLIFVCFSLLIHISSTRAIDIEELAQLSPAQLQELIDQKKASADMQCSYGRSILSCAVFKKNLPLTLYLINSGAPVDTQDKSYNRPIHWAARNGDIITLQELLKAGASIDSTDAMGNTALHLAASKGFIDIIHTLLAQGAAYSIRNQDNMLPMECAENTRNTAIVLLLKKYSGEAKTLRSANSTDKPESNSPDVCYS